MRHRRAAPAFALAVLVGACASHPKAPQAPAAPPPPPPPPLLDASYDWHVLKVAAFGDVFKAVPITLHEVLLFKEAQGGGAAEDAECYAMEQPAPQFIKRTPREFLLCFRHDRLARIEATVMLPAADAAQILADACALWQRNASAAPPPGSAEAADANPGTAAQASGAPNECEGHQGTTGFSARLEEVDGSAAEVPLAIQLDERGSP